MIDFLQGLLELNPLKRWTPQQARYHPFVTGQPFIEPYNPNNLARKQGSTAKKPPNLSELPTPTSSGASVTGTNTIKPSAAKPTISNDQKSLEEHHQQQQQLSINTIQSLGIAETTGTQQVKTTRRLRAQSMNTPTVPNEVHNLVLDMQAHPIIEHHPTQRQPKLEALEQQEEQHGSTNKYSGFYKNRHARSQGDLIGLLPPENHQPVSSHQQKGNNNRIYNHQC